MWDGYIWRKERREEEKAYFAAWMINPHLKNPVTPRELLAPLREDPAEKKKTTAEHLMKTFKGVLEGG